MKKLFPHLLFLLLAAAFMYLPLLAMIFIRSGPVSYVLFYFPPFTSIPLTSLGMGLCAGHNIRRYWYAPLLVPVFFFFSIYRTVGIWDTIWKLLVLYLALGLSAMFIHHFIRLFIGLKPGESSNEKSV